MRIGWLAALACVSSACGTPVINDFRVAKRQALAGPDPVPTNWRPDAVLHLSGALVDHVLQRTLSEYGTLTGTLKSGVANTSLQPKLSIQELVLSDGSCRECVAVDLTLGGTVDVHTPLAGTSASMEVKGRFDAVFDVVPEGDSWVVHVRPNALQDLELTIGGASLEFAARPLRRWVNRQLLSDVPPQEVTRFGDTGLPLVAARIRAEGRTIQVHLRTAVPDPKPVAIRSDLQAVAAYNEASAPGWRLDISPDTLVALAAADAFANGAVSNHVVPVPTSLSLDDDAFAMGLRLWRIKGRGWWRDYEVPGTVDVQGRRITLDPGEATTVAKSRGAVLSHPLAALFKKMILTAIEDAMAMSVPATHRNEEGSLRTVVRLRDLQGEDGVVTATGTMKLESRRRVRKDRKP
ncbi:MAG: hypothetical protein KTR31_23130 [Myxococcales bacterium]|nr:hypothetical protein [Myxococcales bacterium]